MKKLGEACIRRVNINDSLSVLGKIDRLFKIAVKIVNLTWTDI